MANMAGGRVARCVLLPTALTISFLVECSVVMISVFREHSQTPVAGGSMRAITTLRGAPYHVGSHQSFNRGTPWDSMLSKPIKSID